MDNAERWTLSSKSDPRWDALGVGGAVGSDMPPSARIHLHLTSERLAAEIPTDIEIEYSK